MNNKRIVMPKVLLLASVMMSAYSVAEDAAPTTMQTVAYSHQGELYPPVFYVTNLDDTDFTNKLSAANAFSSLEKNMVGLPIGLRAVKIHKNVADGASVSTGLLAASTLGLIPVVSNVEFKVRYDIFVQGDSIANFEYQMTSSEVTNLWSMDGQQKMKPAEELFMENSINLFLNDLKNSAEAQAVFAEYYEYFGENK